MVLEYKISFNPTDLHANTKINWPTIVSIPYILNVTSVFKQTATYINKILSVKLELQIAALHQGRISSNDSL